MQVSLKNSFSVESPNFRIETENARNRIPLRQKDAPFNGELAQNTFVDGLWRETQKLRIPSFYNYTMSSSQVSSDTMLDFYALSNMIQDLILENNMHSKNHKRQETKNFHRGNHNEENPVTSSKI